MPFKSEKQRRFLHAKHPEIAKRWEHKYGPAVEGLRRAKPKDRKKDT
jgi:hypothetical protein